MTQVSRSTDSTNVASNFATNTTGDISAADLRAQLTNMRESSPFWFDDVATTIAAAATTSLGTTSTRFINLTGSTAITSFGSTSNSFAFVRFDSTPTLTHNSTLINLPTSTNIVTEVGDTMFAVSGSTGVWKVHNYNRASDIPLNVPLAAIGGITPAASTFPYYPTSTTASAAVITPFALTLLDDINSASARATLGVGLGTGDLVAANNLSDVASALTSRINLAAFTRTTSTVVTFSNQTTVDFTTLPTSTHKIELMLAGFSTNGNTVPLLRVGSSGGFATTGYIGGASAVFPAGTVVASNHGNGFVISPSIDSNRTFHGCVTLNLLDAATNQWTLNGTLGLSDTAATVHVGGSVSLAGALSQLRLVASNGTDQFDSGTGVIRYYSP